MIKQLLVKAASKYHLKKLQRETGLFLAAPTTKTGYDKAWIRDNIYQALGLEVINDIQSVRKTYNALFDLLRKHEYKIDWAIKEKPDAAYKYIHARYNPITFDEYPEHWGNKQNDAIGAFLFKVGELSTKKILELDDNDKRILTKLVLYLNSIQYWQDPDNGMWEDNEEVHASSIGACLAGLKSIKQIVSIPAGLIEKGDAALNKLLPGESDSKAYGMAQLSLIYPYNIVNERQKLEILKNVETNLVRENGVIRYSGDLYYNNGAEAAWVMGFAWLAKIYKDLGNCAKHKYYMRQLCKCATWKGELPELYYLKDSKFICNENTPLGWSQAMFLVADA